MSFFEGLDCSLSGENGENVSLWFILWSSVILFLLQLSLNILTLNINKELPSWCSKKVDCNWTDRTNYSATFTLKYYSDSNIF